MSGQGGRCGVTCLLALAVVVSGCDEKKPTGIPAASVRGAAPATTSTPTAASAAAAAAEEEESYIDLNVVYLGMTEVFSPGSLMFKLTNTSGKNIKSIKGRVVVIDKFGDPLHLGFPIQLDDPLAAGAGIETRGKWPLTSQLKKLLTEKSGEARFLWITDGVLYQS